MTKTQVEREKYITIKDILNTYTSPLKQATVAFPIMDDQILLALKKRGFAEGKINGVGGKKTDGESIEKTSIRETKEEIDITVSKQVHTATLRFYFADNQEWGQEVFAFVITKWSGTPKETEEVRPQWYSMNNIPYDTMWVDDELWLPHALTLKEFVTGEFLLNTKGELLDYRMTITPLVNQLVNRQGSL